MRYTNAQNFVIVLNFIVMCSCFIHVMYKFSRTNITVDRMMFDIVAGVAIMFTSLKAAVSVIKAVEGKDYRTRKGMR